VIGLIASRIKDSVHRPVFAFAASSVEPGSLRASGRSISGVHLRDVLDLISKREPDLIDRFGGHAMAAGLSLQAQHYARFSAAFEQAVSDFADPACFIEQRLSDGPLAPEHWSVALIEQLDQVCWGQGFPAPLFCDVFEISQQRVIKDKHLKLSLKLGQQRVEAIYFNQVQWLAPRSRLLFQAVINEFNGRRNLEFMVRFAEPA
jgi:single-stranded-DNA-specific exonuclease